jgi:tetratricopeptide (TPR) repeat protein
MKKGAMRIGRLLLVAVAAYAAFTYLEPKGYGLHLLIAFGVGIAAWVGYRAYRIRAARRGQAQIDRWTEAVVSPPARPRAVREIEAEIEALKKKGDHHEAAQRTLLLAEILDADDRPEEARAALDRAEHASLSPELRAALHHGRVITSISAGDLEEAEALWASRPEVMSADLRIRFTLLGGALAVERGELEEALEIASQAREELGKSDLATDAKLLKAIALEAAGEQSAALSIVQGLGEETVAVLRAVGLPRVQALCEKAIDAWDEEEAAIGSE